MATISLTTIANGDPLDGSVVQANFAAIAAAINGGLDNTNISSSAAIDGSKLADSGVSSVKVSATVFNQGLVTTSGNINLTGSQASLSGLSKTITVPSNGRSVRLTFMGELQNNTDALSVVRLYFVEDGTTIFSTSLPILKSGLDLGTVATYQKTPTAGSHTYRIDADFSGGAGTALVGSGAQFFVDLV